VSRPPPATDGLTEDAKGVVYLVGAGPGDPGLLTLRGAELLGRADVVVHDRLSDVALLALAHPEAELVDVGKRPDDRGDQGAINDLLVAKAREGKAVVRLKGGDPFVFGRGGEEALALLAAGVPFEVVPGITSAIAVPASAGVPVTHRGLSRSFTVVAGHGRSVDLLPGDGGTDWEALAAVGGTIVVLMGAAHRDKWASRLVGGGLAASTPVMAVQWGTHSRQSVVRTTLGDLAGAPMSPPVTFVVGQVAGLDLSQREQGLLAGKSVVVTRADDQAGGVSAKLRDLGARVVEVPAIAFKEPADCGAALVGAVGRLRAGGYAWVVFSSANAVERFFELVPDARALGGTRVAAVGPATAEALLRFRIVADLVPAEQSAAGLVAAFPAPGPGLLPAAPAPGPPPATPPSSPHAAPGGRWASRTVLVPQAAGARPALRRGLEALGWRVEAVEAYRTVPRPVPREVLSAASRADAICFASPSAVTSYLDQAEAAGISVPPVVVCIGPTTSAAATVRGLEVQAEAAQHTAAGLAEALAGALSERKVWRPGTR
jgi:uroporphyrinogen III methyltransferase/synthase